MYRLKEDDLAEASGIADGLARAGRFVRVLEVWPAAIYELRRPNGVDFRVSIGRLADGRWGYVVDATAHPANRWRRVPNLEHVGSRTAADALQHAAETIAVIEAPFGDD
jgi:choline dehydrogenase-like flavoprotein